jgi:DNA-binding NtrC family response regulator
MNEKEAPYEEATEPQAAAEIKRDPLLILLTADDAIAELASTIARAPWRFERRSDIDGFADLLRTADIGLVVLDDEIIAEGDRGWLLAQVRRNLPDAMVLYVAAEQTSENEKRARAGGASFYTSKPIQPDHLESVLRSFMEQRK